MQRNNFPIGKMVYWTPPAWGDGEQPKKQFGYLASFDENKAGLAQNKNKYANILANNNDMKGKWFFWSIGKYPGKEKVQFLDKYSPQTLEKRNMEQFKDAEEEWNNRSKEYRRFGRVWHSKKSDSEKLEEIFNNINKPAGSQGGRRKRRRKSRKKRTKKKSRRRKRKTLKKKRKRRRKTRR